MTAREKRTIKAFENCIEKGIYDADYAITLIEDDKRYGWLSEEAKNEFYAWLEEYEASHQTDGVTDVTEESVEAETEVESEAE